MRRLENIFDVRRIFSEIGKNASKDLIPSCFGFFLLCIFSCARDELPFCFKMNGFSTADGFVEITEEVAEMIKYLANEPSVGLFYLQQHAHDAVPNLVGFNHTVADKSRATALHGEDLEDSAAMVRSMKDCGLPIVNDMIKEIKNSLAVMSTQQPKRGSTPDRTPGMKMERSSSWGPAAWGYAPPVQAPPDGVKSGSYLSSVFSSAKQRVDSFKWPQFDHRDSALKNNGKPPASGPVASDPLGAGEEELLVPCLIDGSLVNRGLLSRSEDYDEFRADKEAKLREWLEGAGNLCSNDRCDEKGT